VIYLGAMTLASWRVFKRLEWREGGAGGGSTPGLYALSGAWDLWIGRRWLGKPSTAQLIRKELRLHVVPWLIAGILIGFWGLSLLIRKWAPESEWGVAAANPYTVTLYAGIFGTFVLLATGASAIAEERVLGTLEWQWTQPIPMARQWKIKMGVATALALTLGLILPAVLVWLGFDANALSTAFGEPDWQSIVFCALALVALFATSLYASSVSQSSMKAVALTTLLLASLGTAGALTAWGVVTVIDQYWGNLWLWTDLDRLSDPALLNQMPPAWLPTGPNLRSITQFGAIVIGGIWVGFLVRNSRLNAQRLRSTGSAVWLQWGRLSGALLLTLLLGGLLLVGLSRERANYDQLSMLKNQRERFIQYAAKAEREGNFTREYLLPLGITDRPSPEQLVDTILRQRGFRWMSQNLAQIFQREPLVGSHRRFLMDQELVRSLLLKTEPTSPVPPSSSTNNPFPEAIAPNVMPMSQELMKRYGLLPKGASKTSATMPPKASTNPPANPAPGQ
jgi:hypothetical protein